MSHLYDTMEPNVVSESLLRECVTEQGPQGEAGRLASLEGISFAEVTELRLDFKNILRIENLWQFTILHKLQLDNNIIEDMCGLDMLTQLEWLDLSFNNIEVISGLEKLVNLKDLSLANNRLKTISNLGCLSGSLQILSLASNLITDLRSVECLRPFNKLQSLALRGNPLSSESNYRPYVIAYIPSLVYLDFKFLMENEKQEASEKYAELLEELELHERGVAHQILFNCKIEGKESIYESAYVNGLQGEVLFDSMFVEDSEAQKVELLPDVPRLLKKYKDNFVSCCEQLTESGLAQKEKRDTELAQFKAAYSKACLSNQELSVEKIRQFEIQMTQLSDKEELAGAFQKLEHSLMWLEMQLVEQLDEISRDFELNYGDMVGSFKESVQSYMTQMRELENSHHEAVTNSGLILLEMFAKNKIDDILDDLRPLLVDKDTLVNILNTAHDTHMLIIDDKEDKITQRAARDLALIIKDIQTNELVRNRKKVAEINQYIETLKK